MTVRLGRAGLAVVLIVLFASSTSSLSAAADRTGDECSQTVVHLKGLSKGQRKKEISAAKTEVKKILARQTGTTVIVTEYSKHFVTIHKSQIEEHGTTLNDMRIRYSWNESLEGGRYDESGDKRKKTISYCVTRRQFEAAKAHMRQQRQAKIESILDLFRKTDAAIAESRLEQGAGLITALKMSVRAELLDYYPYRSPIDDREQNFFAWLIEWQRIADRGIGVSWYTANHARDLIEAGHLEQASAALDEALRIDPSNVRALQYRDHIEGRRTERRGYLEDAERLASKGKFSAAKGKIRDAERVDSDDRLSLEATWDAIDALRVEYRQYNPRAPVGFRIGVGSLGIDESQTAARLTPAQASPGTALVLGFAVKPRLGRHFHAHVGLGFGNARAEEADATLIGFWQYSAGFGFRTVRTERRKFSFEITAGVAGENADLPAGVSEPDQATDSQMAYFGEIAFGWRHVVFFIQQGFGFEDQETLIAWSDRTMFGLQYTF